MTGRVGIVMATMANPAGRVSRQAMKRLTCVRHRFPAPVIGHAVCLYLRLKLSYRDAENLLAERGIDVIYETLRRWVHKFGPAITKPLRRLLLKKRRSTPERVTTDRLGSYEAAFGEFGLCAEVYMPSMSRACARTTGPRPRSSRCEGVSIRCSASTRRSPVSVSSPCTPPRTTPLTSNVISSPAAHFESFAIRRWRIGRPQPKLRERWRNTEIGKLRPLP